jgi:AmmeMemoRadiSam system protein A
MAAQGENGKPHPSDHSSPAESDRLSDRNREILRDLARVSIQEGLAHRRPPEVDATEFPAELREHGAAFVTLTTDGRLRGCIGSCSPRRSLVEDVAVNAFAAAFRDPRFPPLTRPELDALEVHLSILTPLEPIAVASREELLEVLRPGVDGLLLEEPPRRSTFLPQVWEMLPEPEAFLEELLLKGGFPRRYWSPELKVHRYQVVEI